MKKKRKPCPVLRVTGTVEINGKEYPYAAPRLRGKYTPKACRAKGNR